MNNKSITDFIKPTIITAQQYGTKVSVEIDHSDTDLDELMDAFETLIIGLGYHQTAWKDWVVDRADEYKEEAAEEAIYKPSSELRRVAEAYVKELEEQQIDKELISDFDSTLNDGLDEYDYDAAFAEHNAHEEGFDIDSNDGGFDGNPYKKETGTTYFTVPVNFYTDDLGNKVYDYEGMADQFEEQLSELDESAVVMVSVEIQPIHKELIEAAKKYKKKVKTK